MNKTVDAGKTLLIDGPASINFTSGYAEILGAPVKAPARIVVRDAKRVPIEVKKKAEFNVMLGEGAGTEEVEGSTIPQSWKSAVEKVLATEKKPLIVMVIGKVDSGKSGFCTFLANMALRRKLKVAIVDGDLGQSDVGPPCSIGFGRIAKPIKDLFDVSAEDIYFTGVTTPSGVMDKVIEGLMRMKNEAQEQTDADFLIVNTDGWVEDEEAVAYKLRLIEQIDPNIVVGIQQQDELVPILNNIRIEKISIETPAVVKQRDREKRKILRELGYKKYLKDAKVLAFPLNWIRIQGVPLGGGAPPRKQQMAKIQELLGLAPLHCEETANAILLVLGSMQWIHRDRIKAIEENFGKKVQVMREGDEEGLLVSLHDANERFLGIGILHGIDYKRKTMKVFTPVKGKVAAINVGQIKLDKSCKELGINPITTTI
ncbi:MAG: Clp1/GlmU family protein [Candidatus Bathyarchaeia archaeon]